MHCTLVSTILAVGLSSLPPASALSIPKLSRRAVIDKPAVKPAFSNAKQERHLHKELPQVSWRQEPWESGYLPEACVSDAQNTGFDPADFEAVEAWYDDCDASWTICRHKKADESWDYILDTWGKIPVGLRQNVANIVIVARPAHSAISPPKQLDSAYARPEAAALMFSPGHFTPGIIIHETAHLLDILSPTLQSIGTPYSLTQAWQSIVASDKAVPTEYSKSSWEENFADAVRWAISHMVHGGGGLRAYSRGWAGCKGQVDEVERLLKGEFWSDRCTGKVASSRRVQVGDTSGLMGRGLENRTSEKMVGVCQDRCRRFGCREV
ncbi:hypothetical protein VTI74DRAFT_10555 [Chaetomium olivicolor]